MLRTFCFVTILMLFGSSYKTVAQSPMQDFFPLELNRVWTYEYHYSWRNVLYGYVSWIDTQDGIIRFTVVGRDVQDTATVWTIMQSDSLLYVRDRVYPADAPGDTTYTIVGTNLFKLTESHDSLHTLRTECCSHIWKSPRPVAWIVRESGPPYFDVCLGGGGAATVERYGTNASPKSMVTWWGDPIVRPVRNKDTVMMTSGVGMTHFGSTHSYSTNQYGDEVVQYADLLETTVSVAPDVDQRPSQVSLEQNFPNPFNPSTTIRFSVPVRSRVILKVFNALGQEVGAVHDGEMDAGSHEVSFDAKALSSGVYFYQLKVGVFSETKRLLLIR